MNEQILKSALWAALDEELSEIWGGPEPDLPEFSPELPNTMACTLTAVPQS